MEHLPHLSGYTRHESHQRGFVDSKPRGGTPVVVESQTATRQPGLLAVHLGHWAAKAGIESFDMVHGDFVEHQGTVECFGYRLCGQIVVCWAKATRAQDQVASAARLANLVDQIRESVAHRDVTHHSEAQICELLRKPGSICICDLTGDDFVALGENLGGGQGGSVTGD